MKNKIIQRFFAVLLGLVMVGTASAGTSYCNEEMTSTDGKKKAYLSCTNPESGKFVMEITSNEPNFTGLRGDNMWCHINGNGTTYHMTDNYTFVDGKVTFTIMASSVQDMYTPIYLNINNDECTFNSIQGKTFDWPTTCGGGGGDEDTEAPVMTSASLVSKTHNSAVIAVVATDNMGVTKYVVYNNTATQGEYAPSDGKITVTGLTPSTAYTLTIKAKDAAGNESVDGIEVQFTTDDDPKADNTKCKGWNDDIWASQGGYTYAFSTSGTTVHIEFTAIGNFPSGFANPQVYLPDVNEFKNMTQSGKVLSYDFENQTIGSDLKIKGYFAREAGADETQVYTYTVGEDCQPHPVTGVSITSIFTEIEVGQSKTMTAAVTPANATNKNVTWSITEGDSYATINASGTVTGTAVGSVTVQVTTEDGNKTATKTISIIAPKPTAPSANPAAPTHKAEKVKAIYSKTYSADCDFGEWSSGTTYAQEEYGKKYTTTDKGYFGICFEGAKALNCSSMEYLHADVWVKDNTSIRFVPVHTGCNDQMGAVKNLTGGQWNSIDIPISEFNNGNDWTNVYQLKIDQAPYLTLWFNNIYFYTTATEMMYAVSATAGDGGSATASAASVASGTEVTFTATPDCGYEFASWTKGGEVIVGAGATYTTPITEETTLTANFISTLTPATPTLDASNVMSVYGHYGNQTGLTVNPWWDPQTTQYNATTIGGETMARYTKINFQGMDFDANRMNVSDMQYVHLDLYASVESDIKFALIWQGSEHSVTKHLNGCSIESFDIPLSEFTGIDLTTIRQLKFDVQGLPLAGKTLIVQNIYFYAPNEFTLSEEDDNAENLATFNGKVCDVTIGRTFEAGNLYTLALPFDMTADQVAETFGACTMYKLAESYWKVEGENMYIRFAPVTEFEANTPILFTPATDLDNIVAKEVTINNAACETATDLVTFHGTYSKMALTALNYILAADQYLYPVVGDEYYINGMRGYFSWGTSVSQAPKMARVILHEEIATDNAFVPEAQPTIKKVVENGQFVILREGKTYNAQGQIIQ